MKILVLGCGAIGSNIAADLILAGYPITVADPWPELVEVIRIRGLKIILPEHVIQTPPIEALHLSDFARLNPRFDVIFLAAKAQDAKWLCEFIHPYLKDDGILIPLMNGMMNSVIAQVIGKSRLIGSVIELSAESFEAGIITRKTPHAKTWMAVGELDGQRTQRLGLVQELLSHTAKVDISEHIENAKWTKLVTNAMILAPFAMLKATSYDALSDSTMQKLVLKIGEEAIAVGHAQGYQLEEIFGLSKTDMLASPTVIAKRLVDTLVGHIGKKSQNATTQDILKGRTTETHFINGLVVTKGIEEGLLTPANQAICQIIKAIELQELTAGPENIQRASQLANLA